MIHYSKRLDWNLEENALARALREVRHPYVDLSETNPTRAGLAPDFDLSVLSNPRALRYEPHPKGALVAREAVAGYYADSRGAAVDPERIVLTASTSEAYSLLFKLLCDPGDTVLVPEPSYPLFGYLTALDSVEAVPYPLRWDGEWHLDAEAVLAAVTPTTRAIVVVSPGNPTGAYLKEDELRALARACERSSCALLCDEVFADFPRGPDPRRVATTAAHEAQLTFTLSGLSKVCGLPQLKLGWCVVSGPPADVLGALARLERALDPFCRAVFLGLTADDDERQAGRHRCRSCQRDRSQSRSGETDSVRLVLSRCLCQLHSERPQDLGLGLEAVLVQVPRRAAPGPKHEVALEQ
jgi:aspartate/methionine/tyrosine aminotransferase